MYRRHIHAFGKRILEEKDLTAYGGFMELYGRLARHFNYSVGEIRQRVKFAEKFPDFEKDFMEKFANRLAKLPTWKEVCQKYLYEKAAPEKSTPLPEGKYDVIYADPPWPYEWVLRGSPDKHYPTMSVEEIFSASDSSLALPVL